MKLRNSLLLLLTATIWGVAFVAQSVGMDYVGPFTFVFARNIIGGLVLLPVIAVLGKSGGPHPKQAPEERRKARKTLVIGGMCCGTALCAGSITQQFALLYTPVGKAGFLTACYILIVPLLGLLFGRRCGVKHWCGVARRWPGVLSVHDGRQLRLRDGRPHRPIVCAAVLYPYHSHRPFFTDGGRREDVLHPVFLLCDLIGHRYADLRATELREHPRGMEAHPVCRCDVVRRGLYPADCRSEGHEPGGSIAYHESGVGYLGYRRLAYSRSGAVRPRDFRLCADVWRYRAGTAAGTEKT